MTVTFFGHRQIISPVQPILYSVLCDLIENKGANKFYVGHNGEFDIIVRNTLVKLKNKYPHIKYYIVLAYLSSNVTAVIDSSITVYPEVLAKTPPRFAISKRNEWLIKNSDFVVAYVVYGASSSAKFLEISKRKGKGVLNLADLL